MATKEQLLAAGFTEEEILKDAGFSEEEIRQELGQATFASEFLNPGEAAKDLYRMPGQAIKGAWEFGGRVLDEASNLSPMESSVPFGTVGIPVVRALYEGANTPAEAINRTGEMAAATLPGGHTAYEALRDLVSGELKTGAEYGGQAREELVNWIPNLMGLGLAKGMAKSAPMKGQDLRMAAQARTRPADMQKASNIRDKITRTPEGVYQRSNPLIDSYERVRADGGFRGLAPAYQKVDQFDARIGILHKQIDPIIKNIDEKLGLSGEVITPTYKNAYSTYEKMPLGPERDAAFDFFHEQRARYDSVKTAREMQNQKVGIYDKIKKSYERPEGAGDPPWKVEMEQGFARDFKETIEEAAAKYSKPDFTPIQDLNTTLGAYYDMIGPLRRAVNQGHGKFMLGEATALGTGVAAGVGAAAGSFLPGVGTGMGAAIGGAANVAMKSPMGQYAGSMGYDMLSQFNKMDPYQVASAMAVFPKAIDSQLPRDWDQIENDPGMMSTLGEKVSQLGEMGMIPWGGKVSDFLRLPLPARQQLWKLLVSMDPTAELPPKQYYSAVKVNGEWVLPPGIDRDMELNEVLKIKDAGRRAQKVGALQDRGAFDPGETPIQALELPFDPLAQLANLPVAPSEEEEGPLKLSKDTFDMLREMARAQEARAGA